MSAPTLQVQVNGGGPVSGDNFNTYEQTCDSVAQLRGFIGVDGVQVYIRGTTTAGDGGQGPFYWNSAGTAPDDNGTTTIVPTGSASGEWTRLPFTAPSPLVLAGNLTVGGNTLLDGTLIVDGNTTLAAASVTNLTASGTLGVIGAATVGGTLRVTGAITATGALTASGQLIGAGTTTNDSAGVGVIGEYQSASVGSGSSVSLSTATDTNIISLSLTAGDWDVYLSAKILPANTTVLGYVQASLSTTSAVGAGSNSLSFAEWIGTSTGNGSSLIVGLSSAQRFSLASPTIIYLVVNASFTTAACTAWGSIWARRAR